MPSANAPLVITADQVIYDQKANRLDLEGHVVIEHPEYRVTSDRASADLATRRIQAFGHVVVSRVREDGTTREVMNAEAIELQPDQGAGLMVKGRLTIPWQGLNFQFQGDRFEKIDDHTYLIERGSFTWCQCAEGQAPDWSVDAKNIKADTEGDAVFHGARINLRNHPVLYAPYLRYPLGRARRSGFLLPEIETSGSSGFQFELPYYQVLGRSMDATVAPRYIQLRGIEGAGEFRYNFGEAAAGRLWGFGIEDRQDHARRGGARLVHRADLGDEFTLAADVVYLTDNEALFDFEHRRLGDDSARAIESRVVAAYHWPTANLTAEFAAWDDLMGGDLRKSPFGRDRDEQMIQRLPALQYTLLTRPLYGPLRFDVQGNAVNYWRQDRDLGSGQLYSLMPRLVLPARLFHAVDFWAAAGYREWFLIPDPQFDPDGTLTGRPEAELSVSAQWQRIFTSADRVWRHALRPEVLAYYGDQPDEPNDAFFRTILPASSTELAGLRLESRLWSRPAAGAAARPLETSRAELTQLYDFSAEEWRDLRIEARLGSPTPWRIALDGYYSWVDNDLSRLVLGLGYKFGEQTELRAGYRYDSGHVRSPYFEFENVQDEAVTAGVRWAPAPRYQLEYRAYYSLQYDRMVRQSLEWDFLAAQKCWGFSLRIMDRVRPTDPQGRHEVSGSVNLKVEGPTALSTPSSP